MFAGESSWSIYSCLTPREKQSIEVVGRWLLLVNCYFVYKHCYKPVVVIKAVVCLSMCNAAILY